MAFSKEKVIDKIEIRGDVIRVQYKDRVLEDGKEISSIFSIEMLGPLDSKEGKLKIIQDVAALVHTPEIVEAARVKGLNKN